MSNSNNEREIVVGWENIGVRSDNIRDVQRRAINQHIDLVGKLQASPTMNKYNNSIMPVPREGSHAVAVSSAPMVSVSAKHHNAVAVSSAPSVSVSATNVDASNSIDSGDWPSNLMQRIEQVVNTECIKPNEPEFSFSMTKEAAEKNFSPQEV